LLSQLAKIYRAVLKELDSGAILSDRLAGEPFPPYTQVLALGKAAATMAVTAAPFCAPPTEGFLLTKEAHLRAPMREGLLGFEAWEAGHPLPDQRSLLATERLLQWIAEVRHPGHLLVLLSGGTSSLLELPAPPLSLNDLITLNACMLASGMPIEEINVIRKHLSLVKGGQLGAQLAQSFGRVTQLVFSDVCTSLPQLDLVGSGPALADPSTRDDAGRLLEKLDGIALPALLRKCQQAILETPKSLALNAELLADHNILRALAKPHLGSEAREHPQWSPVVTGDVKKLAAQWGHLARRLWSQGFRGTLIASGEPTVTLNPQSSGRGGRCQELAACFAQTIAGNPGIALLAGSSDGTDGPTPYAGALVDGRSWERLTAALGADRAQAMLDRNDTSGLLEAAPGLLLDTGPTGHNLNDLYLLRIDPQD
jgi:glycerate-2-kinase